MPQTTYLPLFRASYPILAPVQKPGGVTVSTTLPSNAVPNIASVGPAQLESESEQSEPTKKKKVTVHTTREVTVE